MTVLNNEQKELLFDYCVGLTSETQNAEAEALISSNKEASELHSKLKASLSPLESLEAESCPEDLVEGTIWRLNNHARSSQLRLEQLLASEQAKDVAAGGLLWRNLGKRLATAAVFMVVGGILLSTLNYTRQKYRQHLCQMQMLQMGRAIENYQSDNDGRFPAVAVAAGSPWWKVGDQGKENCSNTRHMWLLVKGGYIEPSVFVCPGSRRKLVIRLDPSEVKNYSDFPARGYVTYSFPIRCKRPIAESGLGRKALIADLNPLFEILPADYSKPFKREVNKDLLTLNSINHDRKGQNVLFYDGSAKFVTKRQVGILEDDIFTLQNTDMYQGVEVPFCEADTFLAP